MLPRQDADAFTAGPEVAETEGSVRLWPVLFHGWRVGYTRKPGEEIAALNDKHREARAKRRQSAGPYYPGGEE